MPLVKVKRFAQVTIPAAIREKAHIEEGDYVEIRYEDNRIVIVPKLVTDKSVDWTKRFDEALLQVRKAVHKSGITEERVERAIKAVRKKASR